jgi:hypothetical protein
MDNNNKSKELAFLKEFKEKVNVVCKSRTFNFLVIDIILIIILIIILLIIYYKGRISDHSMSICLLGTYIVGKFFLNALHMYLYPFKCGLEICI